MKVHAVVHRCDSSTYKDLITMNEPDIPVVDFCKYGLDIRDTVSVQPEDLQNLAKEIYDAFSKTGFVYLVNHGIEVKQVDELFSLSKRFFELPVDRKRLCARASADTNHGWVAMEKETLNPENGHGDLKEGFNYSPKEEGIWPEDIPNFKSSTVNFFESCKALSERIMDLISMCLPVEDRSFLKNNHRLMGKQENFTTLRSLYYPALPDDKVVESGQLRCAEHFDYGTISLLFQDDAGGLEVQNIDGVYVSARPIQGSVVVNIGESMQRWTSDRLKATKHRVVIPEKKRKQSRQCLAFFVEADDDAMLKCLDGSDKYEPISNLAYMKHQISLIYNPSD